MKRTRSSSCIEAINEIGLLRLVPAVVKFRQALTRVDGAFVLIAELAFEFLETGQEQRLGFVETIRSSIRRARWQYGQLLNGSCTPAATRISASRGD
jgi:hypothetical protein